MLDEQIKRLERILKPSDSPRGEPKSDGEWLSLIRQVYRAFNGGFCHNFKKTHYSDEEKQQNLAL
jgi:hypothetical protein